MWLGTLELRNEVPITEQTLWAWGEGQVRIEVTHFFSSKSHGSSSSTCRWSAEFSSGVPGSLVINMEKKRLKGAWGCSPKDRTFGTGIPAARAICIAAASSMLVRSVLFKTNPNGNCMILASKGMLNHEQYQRENWYNNSWNRPPTLRLILPGIGGISGVISHNVDSIGRG